MNILPTLGGNLSISMNSRDLAAYSSLVASKPGLSRCLYLADDPSPMTLRVDMEHYHSLSHSETFLVNCFLSLVNRYGVDLSEVYRLDLASLPVLTKMVKAWHQG